MPPLAKPPVLRSQSSGSAIFAPHQQVPRATNDAASVDHNGARCPGCGDFSTRPPRELCNDCRVVGALVEKFEGRS